MIVEWKLEKYQAAKGTDKQQLKAGDKLWSQYKSKKLKEAKRRDQREEVRLTVSNVSQRQASWAEKSLSVKGYLWVSMAWYQCHAVTTVVPEHRRHPTGNLFKEGRTRAPARQWGRWRLISEQARPKVSTGWGGKPCWLGVTENDTKAEDCKVLEQVENWGTAGEPGFLQPPIHFHKLPWKCCFFLYCCNVLPSWSIAFKNAPIPCNFFQVTQQVTSTGFSSSQSAWACKYDLKVSGRHSESCRRHSESCSTLFPVLFS